MVHYFPGNGGMRYGPSSPRLRHNDRGGPSSDTTSSSEPESAGQALRHQSEDRRQVEEAQRYGGFADRPQRPEVDVPVTRGRSHHRRVSQAYAAAAR